MERNRETTSTVIAPRLLLVVVLLIILLFSGCTQHLPGRATLADPPVALMLPGPGVPKVHTPLHNIDHFIANPCLMLTPQQLTQLQLPTQGQQKVGLYGEICRWENLAKLSSIFVQWDEVSRTGLTGLYNVHRLMNFTFFEPMPAINGHPTVAWGVIDDRDRGNCTVEVGARDDLSFRVIISQPDNEKSTLHPCVEAHQVAELVLQVLARG